MNVVAHVGADLLPAPAVAQRDRDGALRVFLADNVFVELGHDLARRKLVEDQLLLFFCGSG